MVSPESPGVGRCRPRPRGAPSRAGRDPVPMAWTYLSPDCFRRGGLLRPGRATHGLALLQVDASTTAHVTELIQVRGTAASAKEGPARAEERAMPGSPATQSRLESHARTWKTE